jgi:hypothetical protein
MNHIPDEFIVIPLRQLHIAVVNRLENETLRVLLKASFTIPRHLRDTTVH